MLLPLQVVLRMHLLTVMSHLYRMAMRILLPLLTHAVIIRLPPMELYVQPNQTLLIMVLEHEALKELLTVTMEL